MKYVFFLCAFLTAIPASLAQVLKGKGELFYLGKEHLYYEDAGKGEPIVFIHGFTLDARMWEPQWKVFRKRYRAIRYDVRGFGRSSKVGGPHDPAADLAALLDHLKIERTHLVGLSMGANIALNFAVRYPQRVLKIVAADPNIDGFNDYTPELFSAFGQVFGAVAQGGWNETAQSLWLRMPLLRLQNPDAVAAYQRLLEEVVRAYDGAQFVNPASAPQYGQPPTLERISALNVPTLVIVGDKDEESIHRIAKQIAQRIPGAQRLILAEAGHLSNLDQPKRFNLAVLQFLKKK
ncbi:MAG: alpha/beta hydrolase [Saprospiraceae bacterium]|nr:alpha/beta hydrolase [Saprospiraceae bacterium]MDW8483273.1 alpha/beta hydrolase [Saprospiraceae bacterium]